MARPSIPPQGGSSSDRVGPYRLLEKLQDGVLGELWAALDEEGDDPTAIVALRWIPFDEVVTPEIGRGLVDAARAAPWLQHELLVPIEGVEVTDEGVGIVSEYVEGESLRGLLWSANLKRKPLPLAVALRIALDLLDALAFIHEAGEGAVGASALHADSVLVCLDGRSRLLEPSVTWYACLERPWSHDPRLICHVAPEFITEEPLDERSDVFAVGTVLWEILRNRPLFGGGGYDNVVRAVQGARISRVDAMRPRGAELISSDLADVVARALQRTPAARFASARDMAAAIHQTGEIPATADEVTDFLDSFAADALAKQRRTVARAVAKAAGRPSASQVPSTKDKSGADNGGQPDFDDLFGVSQPPEAAGAAGPSQPPDEADKSEVEQESASGETSPAEDEDATYRMSLDDLPPLAPDALEALREEPGKPKALPKPGKPKELPKPGKPKELPKQAKPKNLPKPVKPASLPPHAKASTKPPKPAAASKSEEPKPESKPGVVLDPKAKAAEQAADGDVPEPEGSLAGSMDDLGGLEAERVAEDAATEARKAAAEDAPEPEGSLAGSLDALEEVVAEREQEQAEAERAVEASGDLVGLDGEAESLVEDPALLPRSGAPPARDLEPSDAADEAPRSHRQVAVQSKARPIVFAVVALLLVGALVVLALPYLGGEAPDEADSGTTVTPETASTAASSEASSTSSESGTAEAGAGGAEPEDAGADAADDAAADAAADAEAEDAGKKKLVPKRYWKPRLPDIYE